MNNRRRCKFPTCKTFLSQYNKGEYCSLHEKEGPETDKVIAYYEARQGHKNVEFITAEECAILLNITRRSVYDWLKDGRIEGRKLERCRQWLIPKSQFESPPSTQRETLKDESLTGNSSKGSDPILLEAQQREALQMSQEVRNHDIKIFRESDDILNENGLDSLVYRLIVGKRFYEDEWQMLAKYLTFFDKVSQRYINSNLRELCKRSNKAMERLLHFMEVHSEIITNVDPRGLKYKLYPGADSERFYNYLTNDKTRTRAEGRMGKKVDRLAKECQDAYKEYRSSVRETLFL